MGCAPGVRNAPTIETLNAVTKKSQKRENECESPVLVGDGRVDWLTHRFWFDFPTPGNINPIGLSHGEPQQANEELPVGGYSLGSNAGASVTRHSRCCS